MRLRCIALLAATLATASVLAAPGPGGYGPPRGYGPSGGGGGGQSFDLPSPEDIDGPPTPGTFKQLFALTDPQAGQYSHGWDSLMAATTPQRVHGNGADASPGSS